MRFCYQIADFVPIWTSLSCWAAVWTASCGCIRAVGNRTFVAVAGSLVSRMEELQNLATFLMADGCEWLTGETIAVTLSKYVGA